MGKQKNDAGKLEAVADAQNAPADAADDAAVAAATGQAAEAGTVQAAAGDEKPADATDAGEVHGAADAGADADDAEGDQPDEMPMTIAQLAREVSGLAELFASREPIDIEGFSWIRVFDAEEAEIMADFVLENPRAPLLAMYKHLEIQKSLPATTPNNADMMALSLFRHACLAALEFQRCELAELLKPVPQSSGWPGEQALQVTHSPFEATGFTPSR